MLLYEKPFVQLSINADIVELVWRGRHIPDEGFRAALDIMLAYIERTPHRKILADATQSGPISNDMQRYLEDIVQRAHAAGVLYCANVLPERVVTLIGVDTAVAAMRKAGLIAQVFTNLADARTWLYSV